MKKETRIYSILGVLAGGLLYIFWRHQKTREWWHQIHLRRPKLSEIEVIRSIEHAEKCAQEILKIIESTNVLFCGFDCEWVGKNPTALVQISIYSTEGPKCYLFRICKFDILRCTMLLDIIKSEEIVKIGVGIDGDMKRLTTEFDQEIQHGAFLDLRFFAVYSEKIEHGGLAALARQLLNRKLDKDWRIRASNWEIDDLTEQQKIYAADDSLCALQVLAKFYHVMHHNLIDRTLENHLNKPFKSKKASKLKEKAKNEPVEPNTDRRKKQRENRVKRRLENNTAIDDHMKSYVMRKAPLYNKHGVLAKVEIQGPDGAVLARGNYGLKSRAQWYLRKGSADVLEDTPECFKIRLNFIPKARQFSRPNTESERYYTTEKENQCVVCSSKKCLIRKNVVPREYRKHFPTVMKCHVSHDIVLLCLKCHARSNEFDYLKRAELAESYGAPIGNAHLARANLEDRVRRNARSAGNALFKNSQKIPEVRRNELEGILSDFFEEEYSPSLIEKAVELPIMVQNDDGDEQFQQHGCKIVQIIGIEGIESLKNFEVSWRRHFVDIMNPRHLPDGWNLYHNHERIEEKTKREFLRGQARMQTESEPPMAEILMENNFVSA